MKIQRKNGFTLIEVAIVILIGGILLGAASALLLTYMKKVQLSTTEKRLDAIDESLQLFLNLNGRYPCPADLSAQLDTQFFGVERYTAPNCNTTTQIAGTGGVKVRVGAVPVRTLNLPDDFAADAWGGRFTYAVTEDLAQDGTYNRNGGAIAIVDSATPPNSVITPAGSAHYVLVSHGQNNSGATSVQGAGTIPCTVGTLEEENCNGDATFRSTLLIGTANNANYDDDLVRIRAMSAFGDQIPDGAVMAFNLNACPKGWVDFSSAQGRLVVGTSGVYPLGGTGGSEDVALTNAQVGYKDSVQEINPASLVGLGSGGPVFAQSLGAPRTAHENMPPYISLLYCEKS